MQLTEPSFLRASPAPSWTTSSSFGDTPASSSGDMSALGDHLHLCNRISGHLFQLQCWGDAAHQFVAGRFVTTVAVCAALIGIAMLIA